MLAMVVVMVTVVVMVVVVGVLSAVALLIAVSVVVVLVCTEAGMDAPATIPLQLVMSCSLSVVLWPTTCAAAVLASVIDVSTTSAVGEETAYPYFL